MTTFEELTTPRAVRDGVFVHSVPEGWQQGRGAFGGLVLATLVRAAEAAAHRADQSLRTLTAELCGPVRAGHADILVERLRMGSGTSTLAVRLVQDEQVQSHAVVVLGRDREPDPQYARVAKPVMIDWRNSALMPADPTEPSFARFFDYRNTGPEPFAGGGEPYTSGWLRCHQPGRARDAAYIVGMADVWWPAVLSVMDRPRPAATITFTLDLVGACDGLAPDAPLFHEGRGLTARKGFAAEVRTLWGEDGRLLAINHQTFVVIK